MGITTIAILLHTDFILIVVNYIIQVSTFGVVYTDYVIPRPDCKWGCCSFKGIPLYHLIGIAVNHSPERLVLKPIRLRPVLLAIVVVVYLVAQVRTLHIVYADHVFPGPDRDWGRGTLKDIPVNHLIGIPAYHGAECLVLKRIRLCLVLHIVVIIIHPVAQVRTLHIVYADYIISNSNCNRGCILLKDISINIFVLIIINFGSKNLIIISLCLGIIPFSVIIVFDFII